MAIAKQDIHFCTSRDGVRIAYARVGEGPALVKAANWLTHIEHDWKSPVWRHWVDELARGRSLVRYDERGCGLSDRSAANLSFPSWIDDLETVADAAGLGRFALFGMSQGGPVAMAYASRHPERVSHLILYGTFARGRNLWAKTPAEIEENEMAIRLAEMGWDRDNPAFRETFATLFLPDGSLEQRRSFAEMMRLSSSAAIAGRLMREFTKMDVRKLAPGIRCPTIVLHPRNDGRIPFDEGRQLAGLIPGARFVPLESRNHILLEDEPAWTQFAGQLNEFLSTDRESTASQETFARLSVREKDVLELIAAGLDNEQIARSLALSEKTVRNHITSIFGKLNAPNRANAIVRAREAGFGRSSGSRAG